jgi:uncharacterized lipoprotein YajG
MQLKTLLIAVACMFLAGCEESKDWESAGYQDGYAATINTTCNIRTTLIHGKWDNAQYTRGYARGANDAAATIARQGCPTR